MKNQIDLLSNQKKVHELFSILSLLVGFSISLPIQAQTVGENYIKNTEYLSEKGESGAKKTVIVYYDGLGREKQTVQVGASPLGKDIIVHYEYDEFGRSVKDFLPVPTSGSSGNLVADPLSVYNSYYGNPNSYHTHYYYSEKELEKSPLNRVLKQAAPGDVWKMGSGHEIKFKYQTNRANEVKFFRTQLDAQLIPSLHMNGYYPAGSLYKTVIQDENWKPADGQNHTTEEFKDKEGKLIVKRTYNKSQNHDTYYIYDLYGNLSYVLPPLFSDHDIIHQEALNELGYQYRYDERNRQVEKKLPGKGWEYLVYDKQDRLVAVQDSEQRKNGQWLYTKYDKFGRVVYTGYYYAAGYTRVQLQNLVYSFKENNEERDLKNTKYLGYSNHAFPILRNPGEEILTVNYYDSYEGISAPHTTMVEGQPILTDDANKRLKGCITASYSKILKAQSWNKNYTFYDRKNRVVRLLSKNYLGGYTQKDYKLDPFRGLIQYSITTHKDSSSNDPDISIKEEYSYDAQERLLTHTHQINRGDKEFLAQNSYDELGQLITKKVGNNDKVNPLQKINYSYNIRGWLTDINNVNNLNSYGNNSLFALKNNYEHLFSNIYNQIKPMYNGSIAETYWRTSTDNILREYSYVYDDMNRLTDAFYNKPESTVPFPGNYNTRFITYDKNGNIQRIKRYGDNDLNLVLIDQIFFTYQAGSNKLLSVRDDSSHPGGFTDRNNRGNDYTYDSNGNLTSDKNKGIISISYNHLNLPEKIITNTGEIEYLYDAGGIKMQKRVTTPSNCSTFEITDYLNGFQYNEKHNSCSRFPTNRRLLFFSHAEGYVLNTEKNKRRAYSYVYNYTDHLGNVRISYTKNISTGKPQILEESNYYPFGLKHRGYNSRNDQREYKFKYNGRELQDEMDINVYDYGARNYDPAIGRWSTPDPMAEKFYESSLYCYALNNPITFIDPNGMEAAKFDDPPPNADDKILDSGNWTDAMGSWNWIPGDNGGGYWQGVNGTNYDVDYGGNQINYNDLEPIEVVGNNSFLPDYISGAYNHAVASGQYGRYSPYKPDAFSFSYGFSFQGIFGEASFSIGIAVANGDAALVVGTGGSLGIKPSIPGVKTGAQFAFHDNYGDNKDVLKGIAGTDVSWEGSFLVGGMYSTSATDSLTPAKSGVKTMGINAGLGFGAGVAVSKSETFRLSNGIRQLSNWFNNK